MIALFGGTFDPVHNGHLHGALAAAEALGCRVRLVLSARPPHRPPPKASANHRWAMLELACAPHPQLLPDSQELRRPGRSHSVDTLRTVRSAWPKVPVCWILGADAGNAIHTWRRWRDMLRLGHLVVLPRPGEAVKGATLKLHAQRRHINLAAPAGSVRLLEADMLPVSASSVRQRLAAGGEAGHLLPVCVNAYIRRHGLYVRRP